MKQCNFTKGAHLHLCANQPWIMASELMTIRIFEKYNGDKKSDQIMEESFWEKNSYFWMEFTGGRDIQITR